MTTKPTPSVLSQRVTENVRRMRKIRRWSAEQLAAKMTEAGCSMTRQVIANRESRLRDKPAHVTVDELHAFSEVFGVQMVDLLMDEPLCERCAGVPPTGFRCLACGAGAE